MEALARKYTENASENIRRRAPFGLGPGRRSTSRQADLRHRSGGRVGPDAEPGNHHRTKASRGGTRRSAFSAVWILAIGGFHRFARQTGVSTANESTQRGLQRV